MMEMLLARGSWMTLTTGPPRSRFTADPGAPSGLALGALTCYGKRVVSVVAEYVRIMQQVWQVASSGAAACLNSAPCTLTQQQVCTIPGCQSANQG